VTATGVSPVLAAAVLVVVVTTGPGKPRSAAASHAPDCPHGARDSRVVTLFMRPDPAPPGCNNA
jgi:hypothetical protein